MKIGKTTLIAFLVVVVFVIGLVYLSSRVKVNSVTDYVPAQAVYEVPNTDLTLTLREDTDYVPDEASSPPLILYIEKGDSLYKKVKIPFPSIMEIYGSDGTNAYIGGNAPDVQKNITIVNIESGEVKQYYFGTMGPGVSELSMSQNARYLAYLDVNSTNPESQKLYVHDFKTGETKDIATWPDKIGSYEWNENNLVYHTAVGEKSINFNEGMYSGDGGADIGMEPISCDNFESKIRVAFPDLLFKKSVTNIKPIYPAQTNSYCELVAISKGTKIVDLDRKVRLYFDSNHWATDLFEQADSATGTSFGYEFGPAMATIGIHWINWQDLCPDHNQPIGYCNVDMSKAINEIRIQLWK